MKPGSRYSTDAYGPTDKMGDAYDTSAGIYGSTRGQPPSALKNPGTTGPNAGLVTTNENPYDYKRSNYANPSASDLSGPGGPGAGASGFQRMSRLRSEFYSPQYNATYNQQNGCSITPNSVAAGYHSTSY